MESIRNASEYVVALPRRAAIAVLRSMIYVFGVPRELVSEDPEEEVPEDGTSTEVTHVKRDVTTS